MPHLKDILSQNVKILRKRKKLSQAMLARRTGISTGYIGSIESGTKFPSPEVLERLSEALEVRPYRILQDPRDVVDSAEDNALREIQGSLEKSLISALDDAFDDLNETARSGK